jgi:hypothetical protein
MASWLRQPLSKSTTCSSNIINTVTTENNRIRTISGCAAWLPLQYRGCISNLQFWMGKFTPAINAINTRASRHMTSKDTGPYILWRVYPLLGNDSINRCPRLTRLHSRLFSMWSAPRQLLCNGAVNTHKTRLQKTVLSVGYVQSDYKEEFNWAE